jgi:hypothetical protein
MSGGSIASNKATEGSLMWGNGGGVYVSGTGTFTMSGGTIYGTDAGAALGNTANGLTNPNGAAVFVDGGSAAYIGGYGTGGPIVTTNDTLPPTTFAPNNKFELFWVDEHDDLVTTSGGVTTINVGNTLTISAQDASYTVMRWYLNGVDTGQNGASYVFAGTTAGNHTIGLMVQKGGKLYNSNITVKVE